MNNQGLAAWLPKPKEGLKESTPLTLALGFTFQHLDGTWHQTEETVSFWGVNRNPGYSAIIKNIVGL